SVMHRGVISQYIYVNKYGNNYDGHSYLPTPTMAAASMDEMERPTEGAVDVAETVVARPNPVKKALNKAIPKAKPAAPRAEAKPKADLDKVEVKAEKQLKGKVIAGKEVAKMGRKQPMILNGEVLANKNLDQKDRDRMQDDDFMREEGLEQPFEPQVTETYYRARQFPTVEYPSVPVENELRSDFRSTIYWNGNVTTDKSGKAEVSFFTSDEITSFNATIEGIASDGMVGRVEKKFFSQLPVSMSAKLPVEVITEDQLTLPFTFVNNTNYPMKGSFALEVPKGFELMAKQNMENLTVNLPANSAITEYYPFKVTLAAAKKDSAMPNKVIRAAVNFGNYSDKIEQEIKIIPKGFPVAIAGSGTDATQTFNIDIVNPVDFSIQANLSCYPSSLSEMMSGLEGMLQEPGGCFEQVSSSNYPNILVLDYLQATKQIKPEISKRAKTLIEKGYKMLTAYESKSGGFEWFGGDPGHEGLTAYGLMEFMDMKKAGLSVDEKMLSRTAQWLMDRRDEKGGFKRNPRALHEFGLTDEQTMSAYIVWALSEFQQANLGKELESCKNEAIKTKNPYQLGLVANALANYGKKAEAKTLVEMLATIQNEKGVWTHSQNHRSAPGSEGEGLSIETASLALMAMMKIEGSDIGKIRTISEFIRGKRNSYGSFGNTNSTVLALKALVQYAIFSKKTDESGDFSILVDGKKVATRAYGKGEQSTIVVEGLEKYLSAGKHSVEIKYGNGVKNPLPYTLSVRYYTSLPNANAECKVDMKTVLAAKEVKVGQTLRLTTTLSNKKAEGQGMAMAIVGIPAGLTVQPWQLKELKEKNVFDFYETKGNNVILYYRQLKPSETRTINLDLKAEIPGTYQANASSAYLYYVNEHKHWVGLDKVTISK
ncbi:MAG: alpha-2-macroglobulin family protein, partial [Bacteroidia bacterium]